ncbi:hypothetical protein ACFLUE_02110 [Chloroflexota bacterium]
MRKLLMVLILVVALTLPGATPAFAGDGEGNMPGKATELGCWAGLWNALGHMGWGLVQSGGKAVFAAYGAVHSHWSVINGQHPAKPWWASGSK